MISGRKAAEGEVEAPSLVSSLISSKGEKGKPGPLQGQIGVSSGSLNDTRVGCLSVGVNQRLDR